jgi:hypothetical protein
VSGVPADDAPADDPPANGVPADGVPADDAPADGVLERPASATPVGPVITVANEFAEVLVQRLETRNGVRLLVRVPRAGRSIALCPLELEALTWQTPEVFSAMIAHPSEPLDLGER